MCFISICILISLVCLSVSRFQSVESGDFFLQLLSFFTLFLYSSSLLDVITGESWSHFASKCRLTKEQSLPPQSRGFLFFASLFPAASSSVSVSFWRPPPSLSISVTRSISLSFFRALPSWFFLYLVEMVLRGVRRSCLI